jgi:hypothetical protein
VAAKDSKKRRQALLTVENIIDGIIRFTLRESQACDVS